MSLNSLRTLYGTGPRRSVINKAIRAECAGGDALIDGLRALAARLRVMTADDTRRPELEARLAVLTASRDRDAAQIESKYQIGENTNRSPRKVKS